MRTFPARHAPCPRVTRIGKSADVFSAEQEVFTASMPALVWRRPSDHDPDRLGDAADPVVVVETIDPRIEAVGGGAMRGVVLHKLMEELLTGELAGNEDEVTARVGALLLQLQMGRDHGQVLEMARTALRSWGLAEKQSSHISFRNWRCGRRPKTRL